MVRLRYYEASAIRRRHTVRTQLSEVVAASAVSACDVHASWYLSLTTALLRLIEKCAAIEKCDPLRITEAPHQSYCARSVQLRAPHAMWPRTKNHKHAHVRRCNGDVSSVPRHPLGTLWRYLHQDTYLFGISGVTTKIEIQPLARRPRRIRMFPSGTIISY